MSSYDVVIVGAGHNGLAAAVHLAARGWKVAVVESATEAGGAVKTAEVTLPGFRHDLCAMNLSMFAGSAFHETYKAELAAHGLSFVPAAHCFASVFRDGGYLGVGPDLEETVSGIAALSERDAQAWRVMLTEFSQTAPHIFGLLNAPMPSWAAAKVVLSAWRKLGLSGVYALLRMMLSSPRDFLEAHFEDEKVRAMLAAWGLHVDFAPDIAGGALFPYLSAMTTQAFGMVIGAGGADTMIRAMTGLLKAKGGEIFLGAPVQTITMESGRATGVVLADGRTLAARKAVIANLNPRNVFGRLLPSGAAGAGFESRVAAFRPGLGTMMIHLALSDLPAWAAGPELRKYAYVHLAPDFRMMSRVYAEAAEGLLPAEPVLVVGQPTALDPSRAPEGAHVLWIQVRVLPSQIKGDALGRIQSTDWDEAAEGYAGRVLDIIEQYAPGLRSRILERRVFSPLDLERENANLIGGDSIGGSHHLDQNFMFRPVAGHSRYSTPVKSLYLCGASTWPGAGTGAGSGFMLAKMLAG